MSKKRKINPEEISQTEIILGAPIFGNDPSAILQAPIGQKYLTLAVRRCANNPTEIGQNLLTEHAAVMLALVRMDVPFRLAMSHRHLLYSGLFDRIRQLKVPTINFPENDLQASTYPRDLASWIPGKLLLVPSYLRPPRVKSIIVAKSPYAIGGRVLQRRDVVLVNEQIDLMEDIAWGDHERFSSACRGIAITGTYPFQTAPLQHFRQAKLRIGLLPNAIVCARLPDNSWAYAPDDHPDRVCGLLEDRQGKLHLIVDPQIHSGFKGLLTPPSFGPTDTLMRYRQICEELNITLHVPSQLAVPASVCFWQAPNSLKVLMTGGDPEVAGIVASIVGEENLFVTEVPIMHQPAWCKAGIRCLIGEIPSWLL